MINKPLNENKENNVKANSIIVLGFLMFIFQTIFNIERFNAKLSVVLPSVVLLVIGFVIYVLVDKRLILKKTSFISIAFICTIVYSTQISSMVSFGVEFRSLLIFIGLFIILDSTLFSIKQMKKVISFYTFMTYIIVYIVLIYALTNTPNVHNRYTLQILGYIKDPNYVMAFVIPGSLFSSMYIIYSRGFKKYLNIAAYLSIAIVIILSGSRAAFIAFLPITFNLLYIEFKKRSTPNALLKNYFLLMSVISSLIIMYLFLGNNDLITRLFSTSSYEDNVRLEIWQNALTILNDNIIFGNGLYSTIAYSVATIRTFPHNNFLVILIDFGIVGISIFLTFLAFIMFKTNKDIYGMTLLFSAFFVPLFFIDGFLTASFWLPTILLNLIGNSIENSNSKNKSFSILFQGEL